jgi:hypothetical protein
MPYTRLWPFAGGAILRMGLTETFWGSSGIAPLFGEQGSDKKCHFVWPKSSCGLCNLVKVSSKTRQSIEPLKTDQF